MSAEEFTQKRDDVDTLAGAPQAAMSPSAALGQEFVLPSASSSTEGTHAQQQAILYRMGFRIGDLGLLYPQDASREVTQPPAVSRIPNTASWFSGVANVRGALVPVVDLKMAFGLEGNEAVTPYLLVFGHGDESMGMLIDGLPGRQILQPHARLEGLPPVPDMLRDSVIAGYDHEGSVWLDVNIEKFFEVLGEGIAM